jgi:hypothetical protein
LNLFRLVEKCHDLAFHPDLLSRIMALFGPQVALDMIEILPSFTSLLKTASNSAARSFVRLRSLLHSVSPFRDTNVHRILSYGGCLDRIMEGEIGDESNKNKDLCWPGRNCSYHSGFRAISFIFLAFFMAACLESFLVLPRWTLCTFPLSLQEAVQWV